VNLQDARRNNKDKI